MHQNVGGMICIEFGFMVILMILIDNKIHIISRWMDGWMDGY